MKQSRRNKMSLLVSFLGVSFLSVIVLASTEAAATTTVRKKKPQTRGAYRAELDRVIQEHNIPCQVATECEAIALGAKPCGGPTEYVVMSQSTRMKAQASVSDLTKIITEMDQTANREGGLMGTCEAVVKPEVQCKDGRCVKAEGK